MRTDSAGVTIVQSDAPRWEPGAEWRVGSLRTSVGSVDAGDNDQLFQVNDATRLGDGSVAVSNSGTSRILVFSSDGEFLRGWGGSGGGPGEFQGTNALRSLIRIEGDTLLAWDLYAQTLSVFTPEGQFVRSSRLKKHTSRMYFLRVGYGGGVFADRSMLLHVISQFDRSGGSGGLQMQTVQLDRFNSEGDYSGTVGEVPGGSRYVTRASGTGMSLVMEPVFGGRTSVQVAGDQVYIALADARDVGVYSNEGVLETLVRLPAAPTPVRDSMVDCWWHGIEQMMAEESRSVRIEVLRIYRDMAIPEQLPAHRKILIDADLNLWVQSYAACDDAETDWWVFDPQGVWLGTVAVPTRLELFEIGADYLLGEEQDELDVEFVKVYALERPMS